MTPHAAFAVLLILLGETALVGPLIRYLIVGWEAKRRDIMNGLSTDARLSYFAMFQRDRHPPTRGHVDHEFERLYSRWYGRRYFIAPAVLLALTGAVVVALAVLNALDDRGFLTHPLFDIPWPATAALAGAFMWSVNELVSRARRLDCSPSDVWWIKSATDHRNPDGLRVRRRRHRRPGAVHRLRAWRVSAGHAEFHAAQD